jgi:hypothetical protein
MSRWRFSVIDSTVHDLNVDLTRFNKITSSKGDIILDLYLLDFYFYFITLLLSKKNLL